MQSQLSNLSRRDGCRLRGSGASSTTQDRRGSGFTLVELLVTMVIVGGLLASTAWMTSGAALDWRVRSAAEQLAQTMRAARARAVLHGESIVVPISVGERSYVAFGLGDDTAPTVVRLPRAVVFRDPGGGDPVTVSVPVTLEEAVAFDSDGVLLSESFPGHVYVGLKDAKAAKSTGLNGYYRRLEVSVLGRVTVQKWDVASGAWQ